MRSPTSCFSPDGKALVEYVSAAARWLLECEPEAILRDAQAVTSLIHPEDREAFHRRIDERKTTAGIGQMQYRIVLPSGRVRWISNQASVELLADGGSRWRGFLTDVTAQVEAAARSDRAARMLARTQHVAGLGTWAVEFREPGASNELTDSLWWSDETFRLLGFEPGAVAPSPAFFYLLIHPEDRKIVREVSSRSIANKVDYTVEFRVIRPDGTVRYFSETADLNFDNARRPCGAIGTLLDITERKRNQHELEIERERLALATRAGDIGTWDCDLRTDTIHWNDVMFEIHGVRRGEYEPDPARNYQFVAPEDRERVLAEWQRCVTSGAEDYEIDVHIVLPDGRRRLTRSQAMILRDPSGEPVRVVGIEKDVTEEKRAEEATTRAREAAEAAARAKSEFLATMSHEIRTPMNGVLGYTELLAATPLNAEQREYLDTIEASGEHLLAIVNDVLDVSRIEAGGVQIEITPFDPRSCVRGVFEMLRPVAEAKGLAYCCTIDPGLPTAMESDRGRLAQILTNILGNAVKFTETGEVSLAVHASPGSSGRAWNWVFRVLDSGPGIPAGALPHIFQPFYQVDGSAARRHGGTGLGLTISKRLAELLGGRLDAANRTSGGCEFTLTIQAQASESPRIPPRPEARLSGLEGARILVVEDNPVNRRLCSLQLQRIGCAVEFATTGVEAVDAARERVFDAVLMDMQLPGLDGCEATRAIRVAETASGATPVPIVAMTANAGADDRQRCIDAGMDDYLSKPLRQETLEQVLAKWITLKPCDCR